MAIRRLHPDFAGGRRLGSRGWQAARPRASPSQAWDATRASTRVRGSSDARSAG